MQADNVTTTAYDLNPAESSVKVCNRPADPQEECHDCLNLGVKSIGWKAWVPAGRDNDRSGGQMCDKESESLCEEGVRVDVWVSHREVQQARIWIRVYYNCIKEVVILSQTIIF